MAHETVYNNVYLIIYYERIMKVKNTITSWENYRMMRKAFRNYNMTQNFKNLLFNAHDERIRASGDGDNNEQR